jgi:membrane-bound lytic murein transglycosylase D
VRAEVEKRGLPPELVFLPLIESGFLPQARSASGAMGLWQFMSNSIYPYMKIDEWRDDRRDFWLATSAALSKLEAHYKEFGDWALALAAYNSGAGAIARAIKGSGLKDFWLLCEKGVLKAESVAYVPKLAAIYYIVSNPRRFNLDICRPEVGYSWVRIELDRQVNVALLAQCAGVDAEALRRANCELLSLVTPPGAYQLKVRREEEGAIRAALENAELKLLDFHLYTVRSGDTLYALSAYYGVGIGVLLSDNAGLDADRLRPGQRIAIRLVKDVAPYRGGPEPAAADWVGSWTVKAGDTLWGIARVYDVAPEDLACVNGLSIDGVLRPGRVLRVP